MKTWATVKVSTADGVSTLMFNRPEKRNAMSPQLTADVSDALEYLRYDKATKVVVLTGAGEAFCAGMDLKEFFEDLKDKPDEFDRVSRQSWEWRGRTLRTFPKVVIAMINGYCFGGAFGTVEGCDLAVAAEEATFGLSEINFKAFPGGIVSKALANLFRPRDALFYGLTGRPFDGREAARIGFVNYAVPRKDLEANVMALAKEIAGKDPDSLRATKETYRCTLDMGYDAAVNFATAKAAEMTFAQGNASWSSKEGIGNFLDGKYRPGLNEKAS